MIVWIRLRFFFSGFFGVETGSGRWKGRGRGGWFVEVRVVGRIWGVGAGRGFRIGWRRGGGGWEIGRLGRGRGKGEGYGLFCFRGVYVYSL